MPHFRVKSVLTTLILFITAAEFSEGAGTHQCQHQSPTVDQLSYAAVANTASGPHFGKRQTESEFRPIRIVPFYDDIVNLFPPEAQSVLKNDIIQYVIDFFERALTVRPLQGKILLQRSCNRTTPTLLNTEGYCLRSEGCLDTSGCGALGIFQEEHLAACRVCDDNGTNCETIGQDGEGVENADFILYVTANTFFPQCAPGGSTLAFALPCQLERQYDRPIFGFTNICVNRALSDGIMNLRSILIHEITHALVFSNQLYAFYRDENGNPRTARDPDSGLPVNLDGLFFMADETTVANKEVRRTTFPNGTFSYEVQAFVTPALLREGRNFFGCESFSGVPIEDVDRPGTGGVHFEQRVFNNEIMTGAIGASNAPISRFTLALYEDSGWYIPNYDVADPFRWGMNQGCDFVDGGCLNEDYSLRPLFCEGPVQSNFDVIRDIEALGICNAFNNTEPFDPEFQYFLDPEFGGIGQLSDFCPSVDGYISCKRPRDEDLSINAFAETHGPNSRCVDFRIDGNWIFNNTQVGPIHGGACYEVYCDEVQGPIVSVMGTNYTCTGGKEIYIPQVNHPYIVNIITIVCPPCEDLCWDNLKACPSATPVPSTSTLSMSPTPSPSTTASGPSVTESTGNESARTAAIVLFCLSGVSAIIAVVSGVVASVLFWMRGKKKKTEELKLSAYNPGSDVVATEMVKNTEAL